MEYSVVHHIPHKSHSVPDQTLRPQVLHGARARRKQHIRNMIGEYPINLLRHMAVVRSETCLNVCHWYAEFHSCQRPGQGRIGVAVHHHHIWSLRSQYALNPFQHPCRLRTVGSRSHTQVMIGAPDLKLPEEHGRQTVIVMLSGVEQDFFHMRYCHKSPRDRGGPYELGTSTHDANEFQCPAPSGESSRQFRPPSTSTESKAERQPNRPSGPAGSATLTATPVPPLSDIEETSPHHERAGA